MSNFNSADIAAFKDVWVFCEQREGKLMPTDFELISKGRDLADELGVNLCPAGRLQHRCLCQGHLRRDRGSEARGVPDRRHQHRP